jgi:SEC-C motif-containing protein
MKTPATTCPCGGTRTYADCCGRYIDAGGAVPTAELLMRSRYSAYTLGREAYLLATWHAGTRPPRLDLAAQAAGKWLGLEIKRHDWNAQDPDRAVVEFVARHKSGGRAQRLHETSRFVREDGRWFYLDGDLQ